MLEVLFDDDSSGSDDVPNPGPLPNAQSSGSQPEWQQHVADELTALHLALETRARALNEREAALAEAMPSSGRSLPSTSTARLALIGGNCGLG